MPVSVFSDEREQDLDEGRVDEQVAQRVAMEPVS
jgi:hypothetical protein